MYELSQRHTMFRVQTGNTKPQVCRQRQTRQRQRQGQTRQADRQTERQTHKQWCQWNTWCRWKSVDPNVGTTVAQSVVLDVDDDAGFTVYDVGRVIAGADPRVLCTPSTAILIDGLAAGAAADAYLQASRVPVAWPRYAELLHGSRARAPSPHRSQKVSETRVHGDFHGDFHRWFLEKKEALRECFIFSVISF